MQINEMIMYVMAAGVLLGGIDLMLGNRFGYGERFQEAFRLMGPIGLSMAGIICLSPLLSRLMGICIVPLCSAVGIDPGVFGSILAIDMGGYQLSMDLAADPVIGKFSGIVASAIFGCTIVFTIPVGLGTMQERDRTYFAHGILLGLIAVPVALIAGGLACDLSLSDILRNFYPILLFSILLIIGLVKFRDAVVKGFQHLAKAIQLIATLGLMLGALQYMTDVQIIKILTPLEEALQVVCSIAVVMLGSLPLTELFKRILNKPFMWIGERTGLNAASMTGLMIGMVSVVPALAMIRQMDKRGKIVNGAFLVCAASTFAAHLGFTVGVEPDMVGALLVSKLIGGAFGAAIALAATRRGME